MAWRNIKRNHSSAIPRYIVVLDTETIKEEIIGRPLNYNNYLRCGCAISIRLTAEGVTARKMLHFSDQRTWWNWLDAISPTRATVWIVAHKASFDWSVVGGWRALGDGRFELDQPRAKRPVMDEADTDPKLARGLCVIDDPPFILGLRSDSGKRYVVVDTLNWFRCPLKQLGKDIGIDKLETPSPEAPHTEWQAYCQRDTEIVEAAFVSLVNFVRENDYGMFRYTAPSQAMSAFRHKHMSHKIVLHDNERATLAERSAYYGGETRLFYQGKIAEPIWQLDVNGLYPYVMHECEFPRKLGDTYFDCEKMQVSNVTVDGCCIADVTINARSDTYPIRTSDSTAYCMGEFRTTLCGAELLRAYQTKAITKYHSILGYVCEPIFRDYVDDLFEKRQHYKAKGNQAYELLCKLLLNSLYGKFGQRSHKWVQRTDICAPEHWSKWCSMDWERNTIQLWRSIADYVFQSKGGGEHRDSFPAIPAFVCSAAREYMRQLRTVAGSGNVYYQATDSLFVNQEGYMRLWTNGYLSDGALGKLKIVNHSDRAEFIGPNNYTIGSLKVRSGIGRSARQLDEKRWLTEHFERADGAVARQPNDCVHSWQSIFSERTPVLRGIKGKDGWITPLVLTPFQPDPLLDADSGSASLAAIKSALTSQAIDGSF